LSPKGSEIMLKTANFLKYFVLILLIFAIVVTVFVCSRWNRIKLHCELRDFSKTLEQETLDGLTLKIYYIGPDVLTQMPLTVSDLVNDNLTQIIVVDSESLKENIGSLKRLNINNLVPVRYKSHLHSRMCYIFETDNKAKILEVAFGGFENPTVFVNGIEVAYNDVFRDIVEPFVTEEVMADMEYIYRGEIKP